MVVEKAANAMFSISFFLPFELLLAFLNDSITWRTNKHKPLHKLKALILSHPQSETRHSSI